MSNATNDPKNDDHKKDFDIIVNISNDYYSAYMTIHAFSQAIEVKKEDIMKALDQKNVTFGFNPVVIQDICQDPYHVDNMLVAKGVPHINGKDGEITYHFDTEMKVKPTMNEDGTVDFKNLNFLHIVNKGDVLATKTMPTEGKQGTTVTGKTINGKNGKMVNFKIGPLVEVSPDGLQVIASESGNLQFENEKMSIIKVLETKSDVGVETGNISFSGKVVVNGNVMTGYSIDSDGDVVINGIVEGAVINCRGDLLINGGVQGHDQAKITVGGNIMAKFINNCQAICKGNIEADAIMHSDITCDGSMVLKGKKGLLVGGDVSIRYNLEAKMIGSEMGTTTKLRLGVDSNLMNAYQEAADQLKDLKETITKLSQASRMLRKQYDQTKSPDIKTMLDKTESSRTDYTQQLADMTQNLKHIADTIEELKGSSIKVEDIYPGVKVRIGNSYYSVKSQLHRVSIQKSEGDIKAFSL